MRTGIRFSKTIPTYAVDNAAHRKKSAVNNSGNPRNTLNLSITVCGAGISPQGSFSENAISL